MSSSDHRGLNEPAAIIIGAIIGACAVITAAVVAGLFGVFTFTGSRGNNPAPISTQTPQGASVITATADPRQTPNVVVATRGPLIITTTATADEQDPPPGSILDLGKGFTKRGIEVTVRPPIEFGANEFKFNILIKNNSSDQILVRWKNSSIHAKDDTGKIYHQNNENQSFWSETKQFAIPSGGKQEIVWCCSPAAPDRLDFFVGRIEPSVMSLIITIDELVGMRNMNWQYDIK